MDKSTDTTDTPSEKKVNLDDLKVDNQEIVVVWGTGNLSREFLYVYDMAEA